MRATFEVVATTTRWSEVCAKPILTGAMATAIVMMLELRDFIVFSPF
jgi:hypothetical protein